MGELNHPHAADRAAGPSDNVDVHHEESDVNIAAIFGFGGVLIVTAVIIHLLMWVLLGYFEAREAKQQPLLYPLTATEASRLPPEPRLQVNPREDLATLRQREEDLLHSYGWVDKNRGIVRIPIEAAMKLTLERGLPARPQEPR